MRSNNELVHVGLWLALAGLGAPAAVAAPMAPSPTAPPPTAPDNGWAPVDEAELDGMRGGFGNEAGLRVSIGVERLVSINGNIVARTNIDIADLNHLTEEQARQTRDALSSVKLVQNGSDNIYQAGESPRALGGIVIQNTLNDQQIRNQTIISSTVNSASLLKTINFPGSLSDALTRAVSAR
jgi:hypothetical protein